MLYVIIFHSILIIFAEVTDITLNYLQNKGKNIILKITSYRTNFHFFIRQPNICISRVKDLSQLFLRSMFISSIWFKNLMILSKFLKMFSQRDFLYLLIKITMLIEIKLFNVILLKVRN